MNESSTIDTLVIGAGQAGITLSYHLSKRGLRHLVLDRERPFASWHGRWDSFRANTPNWMNQLPGGGRYPDNNVDSFASKKEILDYLENYLRLVDPPLDVGAEVIRVSQGQTGRWKVATATRNFDVRNVAVCTGAMSVPHVPALADSIPKVVPQIHSSAYKSPSQIESGRVLLVGSGSSGTQICRDLCENGRFTEVHLAAGNARVLPRHILGIPIHRFLHWFGLFDVRTRSLLGRVMFSTLESGGDPVIRPGPKELAREYEVKLHGKLIGNVGDRLSFADGSTEVFDDLTILWCTGFRGEFGWIESDLATLRHDDRGYPIHNRGVAVDAEGLFFVGLRYQHTVASHDFYGVGADAEYIADKIHERSL